MRSPIRIPEPLSRIAAGALLLGLLAAAPAWAWKPYTHNTTALDAYQDAVDDGAVTIGGASYALPPRVAQALSAWPQYYNAGVIGPDGFPDLTFGQAVIHPEVTGEWLRHILDAAWAAQDDASYDEDEKLQVLAFAYGYLTHAAGDMWGHTAVNDWARGVFPLATDVLTNEEDAGIATRHVIVEGYIGDSTRFFDSNPDRLLLPDGDVSDDSTPGIDYDTVSRFLYHTLIANPNTPLPSRGPLIDRFLDLRADLVAYRDSLSGDVSQVTALGDLVDDFQSDEVLIQGLQQQLASFEAAVSSAQVTCNFTQVQCTDLTSICISVAGYNFGCLSSLFGTGSLCQGASCLSMTSGACLVDLGFGVVVRCTDAPGIPDQLCYDFAPETFEVGPTNPVQCAQDLAVAAAAAGQALGVPTTTSEFQALLNTLSVIGSDLQTGLTLAQTALELDRELLLKAYLHFWIDDIDTGLEGWAAGVGLASTRGLFDPQARRDLIQNDPLDGCANECNPAFGGNDGSLICTECEAATGLEETTLALLDPYLESDIRKMLGVPDVIVSLQLVLGTFSDELQTVLQNQAAVPLNPLLETEAEIRAWFRQLYLDTIQRVLGIDIAALEDFLKHAPRYVCVESDTFELPQPLGTTEVELFGPAEHDRLDGLLRHPLPQLEHHLDATPLPEGCGALKDDAEVAFEAVEPLANTVQLSKLVLLGPSELNRLLGDLLGRTVATYDESEPVSNVMVDGLAPVTFMVGGSPQQLSTWLRSIDGDHHWRADGLPRFCSREDFTCCPSSLDPFCGDDQDPTCGPANAPCPRDGILNGGHGNFPLWESCVLRPAFRTLFQDWENPGETFPELGDYPSPDPANDPLPPVSTLTVAGPTFDAGTLFVGPGHQLSLAALDGPPGRAFAPGDLGIERRIFLQDDAPGAFVATQQDEAFSLPDADGRYVVEHRSEDPCHRFDALVGNPEETRTQVVVLDTTPGAVTCGAGLTGSFLTSQATTADFQVADAGSGAASLEARVDGYVTAAGVHEVTSGGALDLFLLHPGVRTVSVDHVDQVGNAGSGECSFTLQATSPSILANLDRAIGEGLVPGADAQLILHTVASEAAALHAAGDADDEARRLRYLASVIPGFATVGQIDADTATRLVAYANDAASRLGTPPACGIGFELVFLALLGQRLGRRSGGSITDRRGGR